MAFLSKINRVKMQKIIFIILYFSSCIYILKLSIFKSGEHIKSCLPKCSTSCLIQSVHVCPEVLLNILHNLELRTDFQSQFGSREKMKPNREVNNLHGNGYSPRGEPESRARERATVLQPGPALRR